VRASPGIWSAAAAPDMGQGSALATGTAGSIATLITRDLRIESSGLHHGAIALCSSQN
jgi:hypothetical protein